MAEALKGLKELYIGKQCNDLGNNNIGEMGAISTANGLKGLEMLWIGMHRNDVENNNLSAGCKQRIKQILPKTKVNF
jgi:hypothetical protein